MVKTIAMKQILALIPLALLAACAAPQMDDAPVMPAEDTCGAAPHAALIGQNANALERVFLMGQVRVIHPDTAVTMDYRSERLNFIINGDGQIARITCG